jgi:hypothetical protein
MKPKIIVFASTPYTGSTFLSILMGAHSEISTISELTGLNPTVDSGKYMCSCGSRLVDCQFFDDIAKRVRARGSRFEYEDLDTRFHAGSNRVIRNLLYRSLFFSSLEGVRDRVLNFLPAYRAKIKYWLRQNEDIINAVLEMTETVAFLDASKDRCRIKYLSQLENHELYVVHLLRDPRGYVNSARKNKGKSVLRASLEWKFQHRDIERICLVSAAKAIVVRYEDICNNTDFELNRIFQFCGLSKCHDVKFEPDRMHLIGNRMRLKRDVGIKFDETWKDELSVSQIKQIQRVCSQLMRKCDYDAL